MVNVHFVPRQIEIWCVGIVLAWLDFHVIILKFKFTGKILYEIQYHSRMYENDGPKEIFYTHVRTKRDSEMKINFLLCSHGFFLLSSNFHCMPHSKWHTHTQREFKRKWFNFAIQTLTRVLTLAFLFHWQNDCVVWAQHPPYDSPSGSQLNIFSRIFTT